MVIALFVLAIIFLLGVVVFLAGDYLGNDVFMFIGLVGVLFGGSALAILNIIQFAT
jgi:hypothetical protein